MSSTWGSNLKISIFGESHSKAIGIVIDGIPAGTVIDRKQLLAFLARRSSRGGKLDTPRIEADQPQLLSGMLPDPQDPNLLVACGTPVCAMIENANTQSKDYEQLRSIARPGHADFTGFVRYHGCNDIRGGGHFSGRLTAPLCFAGAIAKQYLRQHGIEVGAHIRSIGSVEDSPFDAVSISASTLLAVQEKFFPVLDDTAGEQMQQLIADSRDRQDSVGGVIECAAVGLPAGIGDPMFDCIESRIASLVFGIPAVKGIEFGLGFGFAAQTGSRQTTRSASRMVKSKLPPTTTAASSAASPTGCRSSSERSSNRRPPSPKSSRRSTSAPVSRSSLLSPDGTTRASCAAPCPASNLPLRWR